METDVLFSGGVPNAIDGGLFFTTIQFSQRTFTVKPQCLIGGGYEWSHAWLLRISESHIKSLAGSPQASVLPGVHVFGTFLARFSLKN